MKLVLIPVIFFYYCLSKILGFKKREKKPKSVLYLAAFFPENAGYHWRTKCWADILRGEGYEVDIKQAVSEFEFYDLLERNSSLYQIKFLARRFWQVLLADKYETVVVRRELLLFNDYGNLFLERMLLKINPNCILDFDDDLAAAKKQPKEITNWYGKLLLENGNKFNESLSVYKRFTVASEYLKGVILQRSPSTDPDDIAVIPTCVDYDKYPSKDYSNSNKPLVLGWIGGDHNYPMIDTILPTLNSLAKKYKFKLLVIGGTPYIKQSDFEIEFVKWSLATEVDDMYKIDIGMMPLLQDERSKGKGGFKLIQYMGLGIVSVASAVTVNCEIVEKGVDSFLCETEKDWHDTLENILQGRVALTEMGKKAKESIADRFTFTSNKDKYINFINSSKWLKY